MDQFAITEWVFFTLGKDKDGNTKKYPQGVTHKWSKERAITENPHAALQYGNAKQRRNDKQNGEDERVELVLLTLLLTEADEIPHTPAPSAADQKFGIAKSRQETLGDFKIEQYRYDTQLAGVRWHCVSAASATLMLRHSCGGLCLYD